MPKSLKTSWPGTELNRRRIKFGLELLPVLAFWVDEKTAIRERIGPLPRTPEPLPSVTPAHTLTQSVIGLELNRLFN
jgi:hypothetical protein